MTTTNAPAGKSTDELEQVVDRVEDRVDRLEAQLAQVASELLPMVETTDEELKRHYRQMNACLASCEAVLSELLVPAARRAEVLFGVWLEEGGPSRDEFPPGYSGMRDRLQVVCDLLKECVPGCQLP